MGRPTQKQRQRYMTYGVSGVVAAGVLLWLFVFGGFAWLTGFSAFNPNAPVTPPTTPTSGFTFSIFDPLAGVTLDEDDFQGELYETDDLGDWLDFDLLENYSVGGVELQVSDWADQEKAILVLRLNGTVAHDDDLYGDDDEDNYGARVYPTRWMIVNPVGPNVARVYCSPSDEGMAIHDADNMAVEDFAVANITAGDDFILFAASNQSEPEAAWVGMEDYSVEFDFVPNFLITFNDTVALADLSVQGCAKDRYNETALVFEFDMITSTVQQFLASWSDTAADIEIWNIILRYGDTAL